MSASTKILVLVGVLAIALFGLLAQVLKVRQATVQQPTYTTNAGELTRDVLVGQTFRSERDNLSGIGIMFATYSNRRNNQPIYFHLRQSFDSSEDLRQLTVNPDTLSDNQLHRFAFEPIADSKHKTYFFFVTSPGSTPGNAVTVDVDTRNPYHLGTAFVVRGQGSDVMNASVVARSGKPTQDLAFATYHTVPLRIAVVNRARQTWHYFQVTWEEQRGMYVLLGQAAVQGAAFIVFVYWLHRRRRNELFPITPRAVAAIIALLMVVGALVRWRYAQELPITDDEGNYLYDAASLTRGILAGGDGYVKAPLVVIWIALWQTVLGATVIAGRWSSISIGVAATAAVYVIGRQTKDKYTGLAAAAAWVFLGPVILAHVYVHTQPVALFFALSGIALLWSALTRGVAAQRSDARLPQVSFMRLVGAGMLLGLGVASRKSILAVGVIPLILVLVDRRSWSKKIGMLITIGIGFIIIMAAFLGLAYLIYGEQGIIEAVGLNSAEDGTAQPEASEIEKIRSYSLHGMTPFFRESLPLIVLSLLGWGLLAEEWLRSWIRRLMQKKPSRSVLFVLDHVLPKITWVVPLWAFWWCFRFFFEYEGEAFMFWGMPWVWYGMGAILLAAACMPRHRQHALIFENLLVSRSTQPGSLPPNVVSRPGEAGRRIPGVQATRAQISLAAVLLLPVWLSGLAFFYLNWIKFHANYINEFLLPLVILSGVGAIGLWRRFVAAEEDGYSAWQAILHKVVLIVVLAVVGWSLVLSNYITYVYEHTGTFQQTAVQEAAIWARINIPFEEPIFTGAALIPYVSGHRTALNIAHPRWYAYEFTRKDPVRLNTFLPPAENMLQAFRDSKWFLLDKQTGFSFLMEYTEIERGLEQQFVPVHSIENGSNTLTFYRRR